MMMSARTHLNRSFFRPHLRKSIATSLCQLTRKTHAHIRTQRHHRKCPLPSRKQKAESNHARKAIAALNEIWLKSSPLSAIWESIGAWQRLAITYSLTELMRLTDGRSFLSQVRRALNNYEGLNGNDDDPWALTALLNAYRNSPTLQFPNFAVSIFNRIVNFCWDYACGRSVWWDHERTYKKAAKKEPSLLDATSLYLATSGAA